MKTNKIFLSLLVASAAAVFVTSCGQDKVNYIEGKKIHDTITTEKTVEIIVMAVNTVDICADRADNVIKFDATGDWTWTLDSKDTWIESATLSGAKGAGVLKFTVQENSAIKERRAVTTLKINGEDNTLTLVQKGSAPYVEVYNDKIMLSKTMKQAYIENIVSNAPDLIAGAIPDWIESIELIALDDYPGAHQAFVTLRDWDFDSEVRSSPIRFESAADATIYKDYIIECDLYDEPYIIDRGTTAAALPAKLLSGAVTANFSVYANPAGGVTSAVALGAVTKNNVTKYYYLGEDPWVTTAVVPTRAAYNQTTYQITCKDNLLTADPTSGPRKAAIFLMPETEKQAFIDAAIAAAGNGISTTPAFTIDQQLYIFLEEITAAYPKFVYGVASTGVYDYRIHQGYTLKAEMISGGNNNTPTGQEWEPWACITCSIGEPSAADAEGWITYPVTVSYDGTRAASFPGTPSPEEIQPEAYNEMKVTCLDADGNEMPDSTRPINIALMEV